MHEKKKEKDNALIRMRLSDEEYKTFGDELTPESISRVLRARETWVYKRRDRENIVVIISL